MRRLIELLEDRQLLSVTASVVKIASPYGATTWQLHITGDENANTIKVSANFDISGTFGGRFNFSVTDNDRKIAIPASFYSKLSDYWSGVLQIKVDAGFGNDEVVVDGHFGPYANRFIGDIIVNGGDGRDSLIANVDDVVVTLNGQSGNDYLDARGQGFRHSTSRPFILNGGAGNDVVFGSNGNFDGKGDIIYTGSSHDAVSAYDTVYGGAGDDTIVINLSRGGVINGGGGTNDVRTWAVGVLRWFKFSNISGVQGLGIDLPIP